MIHLSPILVSAVLVTNLLIIILAYKFFKGRLEAQEKALRKHFNSILGLSISHLHDAANFFALIKQNVNEDVSKSAYNFSKGAAFHFRSIFDEMRTSFESFAFADISELSNAKLDLLYQKNTVDLRDLLEMELFQISNFSRIEIVNNSGTEHALAYGNYSLLSKVVLNLVENALKHTDGKVKLELKDSGKKWQVKISSLGKSVPDEIVNNLYNKHNIKTGHGLSSLVDILDFHDSKLEILTLADEGSSVLFELEKFSQLSAIAQEQKRKVKGKYNLSPLLLIAASLVLISLSSWLIVKHNKAACKDFYNSKTKVLRKHSHPAGFAERVDYAAFSLQRLKELAENEDLDSLDSVREEIETIRTELVNNTVTAEKNFVSYLLFNHLYLHSAPGLSAYLKEQAKALIVLYPESYVLNNLRAQDSMERGQYIKAFLYFYHEFMGLAKQKLYLNPELFTLDKINTKLPEEKLARELAGFLKTSFVTESASELDPIAEIERLAQENEAMTLMEENDKLLMDLENNEEINKYRAPADMNTRINSLPGASAPKKKAEAPASAPQESNASKKLGVKTLSTSDLDDLINQQDQKLELKHEL